VKYRKSEFYFLLIFLTGVLVLTFFIFKPFLYSLALAIIFAVAFDPIHKKILNITNQKRRLSALLATVFVLVVVVVPVIFLSLQVFQEAVQLYSFLTQNGGTIDLSRNLGNIARNLEKFLSVPVELSFDFSQYAREGLNWLLLHLGSFFANVAKIVVSVFIFLIALYYLFKDGRELKRAIIDFSPLQDIHDEIIFSKLRLAIISVIKGNLAVAVIQGILTSIGFYIFGISNAALWGSVAAIAALIPGIGTALVIIPGIIFFFFSGKIISAIGLLLWGMTAVGLVDNFLGPKLAQQGMRIHPFLILLSILGGISFFGSLGFLLGPLVLSLFFALLEIYSAMKKHGVQ